MPRWEHGRKAIRKALTEADKAGFTIEQSAGHGHTWDYVTCPGCGQRHPVFATPKNDGNARRRILAFVRRHVKEHQS